VILDGFYRLLKAVLEQRRTIPAMWLTAQHLQSLATED
jgi:hypothetical protein